MNIKKRMRAALYRSMNKRYRLNLKKTNSNKENKDLGSCKKEKI